MKTFFEPVQGMAGIEEIKKSFSRLGHAVMVSGCIDTQKAHLLEALGEQYPIRVVITSDEVKARQLREDCLFFDKSSIYYPAKDFIFYSADVHGNQLAGERLACIYKIIQAQKHISEDSISNGKTDGIQPENKNAAGLTVVTTIDGCADLLVPLEKYKNATISFEKGQVLEGTVKNITSYGVFIDLGGVDGLIHITDLSWGRVSDPKEVVELDQKLNVVILDFDDEKKRIALGLKQLTPHPWDALDTDLKVGDKVKGKVVVMADYGAFIEIAPGVEGLIHVSEMSWSQHLRSAQDFMKVGDEVEAVVLTLDREERKMSLGIKQLKQDPWETIEEKYPVGSKHTAKVRNFTNFGVFVEIEEGVDGLIHISDLSWTKKVKHPSEFTQIGADIEVQVLEIDKENRRLSLGHKQLEENPWDVFETVFTVGSVHEGTIIEMLDKGAVVALPYGVEGFATPKHLVKEDGSQAQLDEKLEFKVIEFNKDAKRIILSHSRIFEDVAKAEERAEKKAASGAKKSSNKREDAPMIQNQAASTTLGDIDALAALKEQLEGKK